MVTRIEVKKLFFDRAAVLNAEKKGKVKALSKIGAFVSRSQKQSIRSRKGISEPGQPPSSHTKLLKNNIFFYYDPKTETVVSGPVKLNKPGRAPELLEKGGTATLKTDRLIPVRTGRGKKAKTRFVVLKAGTRVTYKARPSAGPALERERSNKKLEQAFKDVM